jgi:hypothetical protein
MSLSTGSKRRDQKFLPVIKQADKTRQAATLSLLAVYLSTR